jgi:hypothetical protein
MKLGIYVAELSLLAAFWCRRGLFHDLAHRVLSLVSQNPERAVARPVGGDRGPRKPPAVDVPEQVVLRADAGIQLVDRDTGWERHALQRRTSSDQDAAPHWCRRSPSVPMAVGPHGLLNPGKKT